MTTQKESYYDHLKVRVTYPDGKNTHYTNVGELKTRFKKERPEWLKNFLSELIKAGVTHSNFGTYELVED